MAGQEQLGNARGRFGEIPDWVVPPGSNNVPFVPHREPAVQSVKGGGKVDHMGGSIVGLRLSTLENCTVRRLL